MKVKIIRLIPVFLLPALIAYSQATLDSFYKKQHIGFSVIRVSNDITSTVFNEKEQTYESGTERPLNYTFLLAEIQWQSSKPGGFNLAYRNLWTTDFFYYTFQEYYEYDHDKAVLAFTQNYSNGTVGDWEFTYNLIGDTNLMLRLGLNLADYNVMIDYYGLRGYYLGAGPIVDIDYLLKKRFLFSFNFGYWKGISGPWVPPGYILSDAQTFEELPESRLGRPHVWKVHFDITHKSGAFAGFTYYYLIPPKQVHAVRKHLQAGYRFWF